MEQNTTEPAVDDSNGMGVEKTGSNIIVKVLGIIIGSVAFCCIIIILCCCCRKGKFSCLKQNNPEKE